MLMKSRSMAELFWCSKNQEKLQERELLLKMKVHQLMSLVLVSLLTWISYGHSSLCSLLSQSCWCQHSGHSIMSKIEMLFSRDMKITWSAILDTPQLNVNSSQSLLDASPCSAPMELLERSLIMVLMYQVKEAQLTPAWTMTLSKNASLTMMPFKRNWLVAKEKTSTLLTSILTLSSGIRTLNHPDALTRPITSSCNTLVSKSKISLRLNTQQSQWQYALELWSAGYSSTRWDTRMSRVNYSR